jgi:hypothetical protein
MSDGTGLAEQLLGLDGFKVLGVAESEDELVIAIETTASVTGCWSCGVLAECQDRVRVDIRDLACFGPDFGATFVPGTFREPLTWASCG